MKKSKLLILGLISVFIITGCGSEKEKETKQVKKIAVETSDLVNMDFEKNYNIPGEIKALNSSFVSPELPGVIEDIYVEEGTIVKANETSLFKIDSESIEKQLKKAKQGLVLAKLSVEESEANLENLKAQYNKAYNDYKRHKSLYSKSAISESQYDAVNTRYKSAKAMLKHAETLLALAEGNKTQAEIELSLVEQNLSDSTVTSPINGIAVEKMCEKGEMGSPGKPVFKIVNTDELEVKGYLPASYYQDVKVNNTIVNISTYNKDLGDYKVVYKSPVIDPVNRTFEIKCKVKGDSKYLIPGNLVNMNIIFDKFKSYGVHASSVLKRGGKDVVFIEKDGKAKMFEVEKGVEYNNYIQIKNFESIKANKIVLRGQNLLEDGDMVNIREVN